MRHHTCSAQQSPDAFSLLPRVVPVGAAALAGLLSFLPSAALAAPTGAGPADTTKASTTAASTGPASTNSRTRPTSSVDHGRHSHHDLAIIGPSASDAVTAALAQLGKPYAWGADGPSAYDCSGLVAYAWSQAGRTLPHSSRAQYRVTYSVSLVEARAGDLVFFGHPVHHVGIYLGEGRMVEAPRRGRPVRVATIDRGSFAGIRRVA